MEEFRVLQEDCFFALCQKYQNVDCGRISAWNVNKANEANRENTAKLKALLLGAGFSVTTVESQYYDFVYSAMTHEPCFVDPSFFKKQLVMGYSFLVFDYKNTGRLRELLVRLGRFYSQEKITYHNAAANQFYMIRTRPNKRGHLRQRHNIEFNASEFKNNAEFLAKKTLHFAMIEEKIIQQYHEYDDTLLTYTSPHKQVLVNEFKCWQHKSC